MGWGLTPYQHYNFAIFVAPPWVVPPFSPPAGLFPLVLVDDLVGFCCANLTLKGVGLLVAAGVAFVCDLVFGLYQLCL